MLPKYFQADDFVNGTIFNRKGTSLGSASFNNRNVEDASQYVNINVCDFFISFAKDLKKSKSWTVGKCMLALDSKYSHRLSRAFYLSPYIEKYFSWKNKWEQYCWWRRTER
jgi:hypothetical protein